VDDSMALLSGALFVNRWPADFCRSPNFNELYNRVWKIGCAYLSNEYCCKPNYIQIRLRDGHSRVRFPAGEEFFLSSKLRRPALASTIHLCNGCWSFFPWRLSGRSVELTTQPVAPI